MKWFTIIEVLITLVLIGILLGIGVRFNQSYIQDLQLQTYSNQFRQQYQQRLYRSMQTSYYQNDNFLSTHIYINPGSPAELISAYTLPTDTPSVWSMNQQNPQYRETLLRQEKISISILSEDNLIHIRKKPYALSCIINDDDEKEHITFQLTMGTASDCFTIEASTCKIQKRECSIND